MKTECLFKPQCFVVMVLLVIVASGCNRQEPASSSPPACTQAVLATELRKAPKAELRVMADGALYLDGQPASLVAVDKRLNQLAKENGAVWYYRESFQAEPPPSATQVIKLMIKYRLPITMSSKPDFSDTIDSNGVSHPRR
jgi:hypothetical protein